ncbi:MurR/RpiR family transcriptional regulator [Collinsella sp. zg1085]|uniref:MurR/RpiR family transcriptional regulator n=1 Tax=Collinsella sp. zg1085 TaxID=2844380 RepID=UPI001C0CF9CB|nr:MurR/RpiR family transcriptional regulator [Collinsella sp. zg1085]QWT17651.1 MurR/RpiR family transcriptional regulator [Collinsella sp. zg1085]
MLEHNNPSQESIKSPPHSQFSIKRFSLMNSLMTVLNQSKVNDPNHVMARYFLDHFEHLSELNVYEVANDCFTSRSGIRRFCQSIGFENFSAIKNSAYEWNRHRNFFVTYANHSTYHEHLKNQLDHMSTAINAELTTERLNEIADQIAHAHEVVLIASDFSSTAALEFQQSMLFMHKLIRILSDSFGDASMLNTLCEHDLVIVISASGTYSRIAAPSLADVSARRLLITLNHDPKLAEPYDDVQYLSPQSFQGERTVFARYGINYFFDLLYHRYFIRHEQDRA